MAGQYPLIDELLLRWEERRKRGEPVDLQELCAQHPNLLDDLLRQITALKRLDRLLGSDLCDDTPDALKETN